MKRFDRKFGADFIAKLPAAPAVYLYKDDASQVIYVGKAKDVRKRLSCYRNASRRKVHRKMREIVRAATALEVRLQETEQDALAVENELIRKLKPPFNVAGKYSFLYPAIGIKRTTAHSIFCFATDVDAWGAHEFQWFGTFSSRPRAKEAFDALIELLARVGHLEKTATLRALSVAPFPDVVGSRIVGVRRLDATLFDTVAKLLGGESTDALRVIVLSLLEKPGARRDAHQVQSLIRKIKAFYRKDLEPLHQALRTAGQDGTFVPQDERDLLFIRQS